MVDEKFVDERFPIQIPFGMSVIQFEKKNDKTI